MKASSSTPVMWAHKQFWTMEIIPLFRRLAWELNETMHVKHLAKIPKFAGKAVGGRNRYFYALHKRVNYTTYQNYIHICVKLCIHGIPCSTVCNSSIGNNINTLPQGMVKQILLPYKRILYSCFKKTTTIY